MTSFEGGPADGRVLLLKRSPLLLRVVIDGDELDALDQLADEPKRREAIAVYQRVATRPRAVHFKFGGCDRRASGWYPESSYRFVEPQPDDGEVRSTENWRSWARRFAAESLQ